MDSFKHEKVKVAIVAPEKLPVPPTSGGAVEFVIYEQAKLLSKYYNISVVSKPGDTTHNEKFSFLNINDSFANKICEKIIQKASSNNPIRILAKLYNVVTYSMKVAIKLNNKYKIIYIHNDPNFIPIIKLFNSKSKIVLHMHNDHFNRYKFLHSHYQMVLNNTDKLICVSKYIKNQICENYNISEEKITVVLNGVDTHLFKRYSLRERNLLRNKYNVWDRRILLYVGRLNYDKGVHVIISALKILDRSDCVLIIAGSSWFKNGLKNKYTEDLINNSKDLKDQIIFTGYITGKDLYVLYSSADIFICPSIWKDPSPLVLYEALASQIPIICTRTGGSSEIIKDGRTGILIRPNNPIELANTIKRLLNNRKLSNNLANAGRKYSLTNYTWSKHAHKIVTILKEI